MERADLIQARVILVSGRGEGFCAGFDLVRLRRGVVVDRGGGILLVLDGIQAVNHLPNQPWDPDVIDYQMMSRFVRGFSLHADKPTVVKIHGYRGRRHRDIALHADQVIAAADAKIGYPPTRVWGAGGGPGAPARRPAGQTVAVHRRLHHGRRPPRPGGRGAGAGQPRRADRTTRPLTAALPVNQLIMVKLRAQFRSAATGCGHQQDGQHCKEPDGATGTHLRGTRADAVEHGFRCGAAP